MRKFLPFILLALTSCTTLPQLYQAAEDIADDIAVRVEISKEAIQKDTDINVAVDVGSPQQKTKK